MTVEGTVSVKEHFEKVLSEKERATLVAEREREKAASIARDSMHEQFSAADLALERHITEQVQQIRQVIASGEKAVEAAFASSEKAIQKAEIANEKRFDSVNGFQRQLTTQAATMATREMVETNNRQMSALIERNREDLAEQRGAYLPNTTFDTALAEWSVWRNKVDVRDVEQLSNVISRRALDDILAPIVENVTGLQQWQFKIIGALAFLGVFAPLATGLAVYFMTRTAIPITPPG